MTKPLEFSMPLSARLTECQPRSTESHTMSSAAEITVVVVDDEEANLVSLRKIFQKEGFRALTAESAKDALELCRQHRVDVVLTDLMMPGMSGIDLVKALRTVAPDTEVVLMTAYGTIETAVEAMREGAYDFVEKPLKRLHIVKTVRKAAERHALVAENRTLRKELSALKRAAPSRGIVGSSPEGSELSLFQTSATPRSCPGMSATRPR